MTSLTPAPPEVEVGVAAQADQQYLLRVMNLMYSVMVISIVCYQFDEC